MPLQGRPGIRGAARRNARRHLVRLPGAGADLWLAGGPGTVRRRRRVASGRFTRRCDPVRLAAGRAGTPRSDGPVRGRPGATRGTLVFSRHERVPLPPRDHGARVVGGGDHRPRRAYRWLGQSRRRGAAPRYRERRDSPDHSHPHPAAHGPHLGALHPGRERDFGRPGGLAHAGVLAHRAVGRDPRVHRRGADELVGLRVRRRLGPDRALPPHRSDGPPARLMDRTVAAFETGARYQMYHALALLLVAWAMTRWPAPPVRAAGWLFVVGTVIFSGSLYALALTGTRAFGAVTPVGGLCFLAGWASLALA